MTEETYWRISEAAECLGVHPLTLRNWASAGKGPKHFWTKGGARVYLADDVRAWKKENPRNGTNGRYPHHTRPMSL
jgi:hypothetical protein